MSSSTESNKELNAVSFKEYLKNKNIPTTPHEILEFYKGLSIWSQLTLPVTILEFGFSKVPFVAAPTVITDVALGIGNLAEQYNLESVKPSDITGFGSSVVSFVGGSRYNYPLSRGSGETKKILFISYY